MLWPAVRCRRSPTLLNAAFKMIDLEHTASTVADLAAHMDRLRTRTLELREVIKAAERGYFTPSEDEQVFSLWVSYYKTRGALLEVIDSIRKAVGKPAHHVISEFTVAYSAALVLIDAARFLRNQFGENQLARRKLNESHLSYGIPKGSFDEIQLSLTDPYNAIRIREATEFYDLHADRIREEAQQSEHLKRLIEVIETRIDAVRVAIARYFKVRLDEYRYQLSDVAIQGGLMRALYAFQEWGSRAVSSITTMPGHVPCLPDEIASKLRKMIHPGDVFVTRKDSALTNYFLPGYWPHAALYAGEEQVIESLKDGVRERGLDSPFGNDAIALIRPRLEPELIRHALERARTHVGKPYDFDFDFTRSDRLVCTEVVYRSYSGIGEFHFTLTTRAGRQTLSAEDLLRLAMRGIQFDVVSVYCRACSSDLLSKEQAAEAIRKTMEEKNSIG